jgi:dephospho-CoA kinase
MSGQLTDRAKRVMNLAREEAARLKQDYVGTEHLLLGIIKEGAGTVVLDGLYSWSEDKYLRQEFGDDIITIAVVATKSLRRQRITERVDERVDQKRKYSLDEIIEREIAEIENIEKGGPIAYADFYVMNDGDLENMQRQLDRIVKGLKKS